MQWIFGSFRRDALFFIAPGLIALVVARFSFAGLALASLAVLLESGHVATTAWRTWLHEAERQRSATSWTVPVAAALLVFAWSAVGLPFFWPFAICATLLHYSLQFVRIAHWNDPAHIWSRRFAYALMFLPVLAFHFRSGVSRELASFVRPNPTAFAVCTALYALVAAAYIVYEIRGAYRPSRTWPLTFSAALYAICFFFGRDLAGVLAPLTIAHAIGYLALNTNALRITRAKSLARPAAVVIATSFAFGLVAITAIKIAAPLGSWMTALLAFYVVPSFCHTIFDTWLWSRTHWESRLVYGLSLKRADIVALEAATPPKTAAGRAS